MWEKFRKPINFYKKIKENNISLYAGSWSFFLLLTVVPLLFLMIMAFDFLGLDARFLITDMPPELKDALTVIFDVASTASNGATFVFAVTVVYSATKLFTVMIKDGELIYLKKRVKNGIVRKIAAFFVLFIVFLIFIALAAVLLLESKITAFIPSGKFNKFFTKLAINAIVISVVYGIIVLLNVFICPIKHNLKNILLGSFVSLAAVVMGSIGFVLYVHFFASYGNLYGSLASVVVFMLWSYIIMYGLVAGNVLTKFLTERRTYYGGIGNKKLYKSLRRNESRGG